MQPKSQTKKTTRKQQTEKARKRTFENNKKTVKTADKKFFGKLPTERP